MTDAVSLLIAGHAHQEWLQYRIDSDLLQPADDWQLIASYSGEDPAGATMPDFVFEGASAKILIGDEVVLDGLVEFVDDTVEKRNHHFEIYGRDRASLLLDCSAPLLSLQKATLQEIITKAVRPLGIKDVKYLAKPSEPRKKVQTEPGQSVWEWLQIACEANQVWPWFAPDGTLIIGQPDYKTPPVATLILRFDGQENNVLSMRRVRSMNNSFSEITVLGQSAGFDGDVGQHDIKATEKDATLPIYRPRVVVDGNCETKAIAQRRAKKLIADSRLERDRLQVMVEGHRVATEDGPGPLWEPGMRVRVISEPHKIDAVYFLIRRTFIQSKMDGTVTQLHFIADGTWVLDTAPVKEKKGRKSRYAEGDD